VGGNKIPREDVFTPRDQGLVASVVQIKRGDVRVRMVWLDCVEGGHPCMKDSLGFAGVIFCLMDWLHDSLLSASLHGELSKFITVTHFHDQ